MRANRRVNGTSVLRHFARLLFSFLQSRKVSHSTVLFKEEEDEEKNNPRQTTRINERYSFSSDDDERELTISREIEDRRTDGERDREGEKDQS